MNTSSIDTDPRAFLPRWLPSSKNKTISTQQLGEGDSDLADSFQDHLDDWSDNRTLTAAEALIAYAYATGRISEASVKEAASYVLRCESSRLSEEHARLIFETRPSNGEKGNKIGKARRLLRTYPHSPIAWSDLAYYQCINGKNSSARSAALIADHLGNGAPSIALPTSRCMVHLDEPDVALRVVRKSLRHHDDPRVLAAEMACAQLIDGKPSGFGVARKLIGSGKLTVHQETILRAAVATEMVIAGSNRKAKKILSDAVLKPDENTLAQLVWLSGQVNFEMDSESQVVSDAYEASGLSAYRDKRYEDCLDAMELWGEFQPFSITAISTGSYVAGMFTGDHARSLKMLERGQIVGRDSFTVWNNSAFDYAKLDRLAEAKKALNLADRLASSDGEKAVLSATKGLFNLRSGRSKKGADLYRKAVAYFTKEQDKRSASIATLMWAEEAARMGHEDVSLLITQAENFAKEGDHIRVKDAIKLIRNKIRKDQ